MALDASDNVIVGTEPSGLIMRVSPAGQGFVLYQAPKREITTVAVATDGTIYAAGVGIRSATPVPAPTAVGAPPVQVSAPVPPGLVQVVAAVADASAAADSSHPRQSREGRRFIVFKRMDIRAGSGATRRI